MLLFQDGEHKCYKYVHFAFLENKNIISNVFFEKVGLDYGPNDLQASD